MVLAHERLSMQNRKRRRQAIKVEQRKSASQAAGYFIEQQNEEFKRRAMVAVAGVVGASSVAVLPKLITNAK